MAPPRTPTRDALHRTLAAGRQVIDAAVAADVADRAAAVDRVAELLRTLSALSLQVAAEKRTLGDAPPG